MTAPKVSIVTVNRNMAAVLGPTLDSVLAQDFASFEAIVIDGGSDDGSTDVISAHAPDLAYWVSEPDRNLYDAMNKGVRAARGEWILFMNAGDRFAAPDVLSRVFCRDRGAADLLYGHHIRRYPGTGIERLIPAEPPAVLPRRMNCSHQSLFMRREILLAHPFATDLLAADYEVILSAYAAGLRFVAVDCVIASTETGGRSDRSRLRSLRERVEVLRRHGFLTPGLVFYYGGLMLRVLAGSALKRWLPQAVTAWILRHRPIKGLG